MNPMKRILPVWFVMVSLAVAADKSAEAVKAAEKSWALATASDDEVTLKKVLGDDLTYTHSTGETDSKQAFMDNLKSGVRKYHKVNHDSMDVRLYGNTAVLTATAQIETSQKDGNPTPAHLRFIHVWVFKDGRWQLVAHQSLRLQN